MWPFGKKEKTEKKLSPEQQRVQEFAAQFENEEIDLVALTGPEGLCADPDGETGLLLVSIPLTAWMDEYDGVVHEQAAGLVTLADERLRSFLRGRVYPDFIIKVKARPGLDGKSFQLIGLPEPGFDPELKALLERQKTPESVQVEGVGQLTLNRRLGYLQGEVAWAGSAPQLTLEADKEAREELFAPAARLLAQAADWDERARALARDALLDQVNGQLEEDGEDAVDGETFTGLMEPESIQLSPAGVALWYGSELLCGQSICVTGTVDGPEGAALD